MSKNTFEVGNKFSKGRKPGAISPRKKVQEILASMNYEPFEELVKIARTAKSEKVRCDAAIELCNYVAPKLKSVELTGDNTSPFIITLNMSPQKTTQSITVSPVLEHLIDEEKD